MLEGTRIRLRAIERTDIPLFVRWLNDPEVTRGLLMYLPQSTAMEEAWFEDMLKRPAEEHPLMIELRTAEGWEPVGDVGFHAVDWKNQSAEIGIFIGEKKYWNQGLGRDAMRLMLRHGFNNLNLHRIYLHVFDTNPRAIRSYENAGFVLEGRLRHDIYKDGSFHDVLMMSVLRPEWKDCEV